MSYNKSNYIENVNKIDIFPSMKITGTKINYYHICHTKLWLFSHNISFESENESVQIGKLLHEERYSRNKKDITFDNTISVDFIKKTNNIIELHEIKKTKKMEEAHISQMKYYLYYLKKRGINTVGIMNYPLLNQTKEVKLTKDDEENIEKNIIEIQKIINGKIPHPIFMRICPKCAYFEFCFSGEEI